MRLSVTGLLLLLTVPGPAGAAPEPPLPGEDGPRRGEEVFQPLLQPGDELPPESVAPELPESGGVAPPELFPEMMPGGSDGVDGLPDTAPGLAPPGGLPEPGTNPGLPLPLPVPDPAPVEGLLPPPVAVPGMELAARAYWHSNPRKARALAKEQRKPLLIFFRQKWKSAPMPEMGGPGGDPNIALNNDLLSSREFNDSMADRVILTQMLYPIGSPSESDFPPAKLAALKAFKDYFQIKGFPTLLLLDENGREIERVRGYVRRRTRGGTDVSTAGPILDRLKEAVRRREEVVVADRERLARLAAQNYREWTSFTGSKLLARFVSASPEQVVLMDERGALRRVAPDQLSLVDRAVIHRMRQGTITASGQPR